MLLLLLLLKLETRVATSDRSLLTLVVRLIHASVGVAADTSTPTDAAHTLVFINAWDRFELILVILIS